MKRFLLLVVVAALTALAIAHVFRGTQHSSNAAVTALLPKETLAFVYVPDFNKARADFHETDLYQLWSEPAVQAFLQKPRTKIPKSEGLGQTIHDLESLEMKDAFVAVTSLEYSAWKIVGGFRFKEMERAWKRPLRIGWRNRRRARRRSNTNRQITRGIESRRTRRGCLACRRCATGSGSFSRTTSSI